MAGSGPVLVIDDALHRDRSTAVSVWQTDRCCSIWHFVSADLVQDALHRTFARLKWFKPNHGGSLRAYLRRSIENRIRDELRRAACRRDYTLPEERIRTSEEGAPQFRQLMDDETWGHYLTGLKRLTKRDRRLLVGRAELGYNYRQLAFVEGLTSANAARKAVRRALVRLISVMPDV